MAKAPTSPKASKAVKRSSGGIVKRTVATRARGKISDAQARANMDFINKFDSRNMRGGVGIPGGRKLADVRKFAPLDFKNIHGELKTILQTSKDLHAMKAVAHKKKAGKKELGKARQLAGKVNRRIVFQPGQMGEHSVHTANDIAAVWNSEKQGKSKVYDYASLAPKLETRVQTPTRSGKKYWTKPMTADQRRAHIATAMGHAIEGDIGAADKAIAHIGPTARGQKWVNKMSSLMMAERGREVFAGKKTKETSAVHAALRHVADKKTFSDVFVNRASKLAPFAQIGGAKTFRNGS
ncbi:MAG: hypothetical protein HY308_02900 [Gammaproteobacteria bacterium]|nr:hypothetical protein [Gammaproteobacteria bacterium]